MATVLVLGGGMIGMSTAMLLAGDGHEVTVLERDPAPPPADAQAAWDSWERRGVNQFRMLHLFLPRFRKLMETELPGAVAAFEATGAVRYNQVAEAPAGISGGWRPGDEAFDLITARRPVMESVLARVVQETRGVSLRRGVAVEGLVKGPEAVPGVPHIVGARTEGGEELRADLVVDATGRRSPLPRWLADAGARPVEEEMDDSGFVYYGRHFRSGDDSIPQARTSPLSHYGSVSVLTLPADNGTWGVGIIATAGDAALRGLRQVERWEAALARFPTVAHWMDGTPLEEGVAVMAKIEDRIRRFVIDDRPVATGVAPIGDSWACTNPSIGRGLSIGLIHAVALRDLLGQEDGADPGRFALAWHRATRVTVEPWYRATLGFDRHRLAEAEAATRGQPYDPGDPVWEMTQALQLAATRDPDVLRGFLRIAGVLASVDEVFSEPGFVDKVIALGADWREQPSAGPSREELVEAAS